MKAIGACPQCFLDQTKDGGRPRFKPINGELDDSGIIHVNCESGHYGVILYDARRYEVLVNSAARAFLDGYTNEVVAVMSSALERSYEFYIRVSCLAKEIAATSFEGAWKSISVQSERQFGAFQFLYLIDHGESLKLDPVITETRNKVVHRGKIVREAEALEFAEKAYLVIKTIEGALQKKFPEFVKKESQREVKAQEAQVPHGVEHMTLSITTVNVDREKNEVTGVVSTFIEQVAAIYESRKSGFPE